MFFPLTKNEKFWDKNKKLLFIEDLFWMSKAPKELQELSYDVLDVDFCELDIDEEELHTFVVQLAEASGEILNEYHKVGVIHLDEEFCSYSLSAGSSDFHITGEI